MTTEIQKKIGMEAERRYPYQLRGQSDHVDEWNRAAIHMRDLFHSHSSFALKLASEEIKKKDEEIANKDSLIRALESDNFNCNANLENHSDEIAGLKGLIESAFNYGLDPQLCTSDSWQQFKTKHNL